MRLYILLVGFFFILVNNSYSQCHDQCYGSKQYTYTNQDEGVFNAKELWRRKDAVNTVAGIYSVDIDNDGIPELITHILASTDRASILYVLSNQIRIFDINSGKLLKTIRTHYFGGSRETYLFADITGDCIPEVFVVFADVESNPEVVRKKIGCYDLDGNLLWVSDSTYAKNVDYDRYHVNATIIQIADFNQDGIPELYMYNEIYNARTGVKLCDGGENGVGVGIAVYSTTVAVDLDGDGLLELAAGYSVYKVDISNPDGMVGNSMTAYNQKVKEGYYDGFTAVADLDNDGLPEVIVSPKLNFDSVYIYIYKYRNGSTQLLNYLRLEKSTVPSYSPILIGNVRRTDSIKQIICFGILLRNQFDLEPRIMSYSYIGDTLQLNWSMRVRENSDETTPNLFDLDGDGIAELIHRGSESLRIYDISGSTPRVLFDKPCLSRTSLERVLITGSERTGNTRMCITCADTQEDLLGDLVVFGPPDGYHWAPARNIMHQYVYNPLFINDDGTVPQYMENLATYKNGKYNNFMVQESLIDEDGNYPIAAASLIGNISCINYDIVSGQYSVDFVIHNRQDASASAKAGVAVAFYTDNPERGGTLIGVYHTGKDIHPDSTLSDRYSFIGNELTTLWMVVNTNRYPITVSDKSYYGIDECDYTDNVYIAQIPKVLKETKEICKGDDYDFYGTVLTKTGQYIQAVKSVAGCDSIIAVLDLVVTNIKQSEAQQSSCMQYTWNGRTYTTSGSYTYQTISVNGCDSIATLHLTIHQPDEIKETKVHCGSYEWNGQNYTKSGMYSYQTQNIHGCDSIVTIDLKINPEYQDTIQRGACDSYAWNGQNYAESGTYTYIGQTTQGCDSMVTMQLTISDILYTDQSINHCDSYTWNGKRLDKSGDYSVTEKSINGCDSIATLHLTIYPSTTSQQNETVCDTYTWNNQTYTQTGDYTFKTQNIYGCDSIATLRLTIHPSTSSSAAVSKCGSYEWNGQYYTESDTYTYRTTNTNGCDSVATLQLTIHQADDVRINQTVCDSYTWNSQTYTQTGDYTYQTQNIYGCDSTTTLRLTIYPSSTQEINETACDSIIYLGQTLRKSGQYTFNLQTLPGCDSIVTLNLTISGDRQTETQSACGQYIWPVNKKTYDQTGIYEAKYENITGCDSTITLNLTINPLYEEQKTAEACGYYEWAATKQRYKTSGMYKTMLRTTQGCDSTIILYLTVHPEYEYYDTIVTSEPYLWPVSKDTYEQSGIYSKRYESAYACDSIRYLHLTISYKADIYFPNVITPESRNGYFTGYSTVQGMRIERLTIYDRWGNLIYQSEQIPTNEPESGWDGKYKGSAVVPGVYIWVAKTRNRDLKEDTYTGNVTVIR